MKSYTDLEQSKKLAKILPLESADMSWKHYVSDSAPEGYCISLDTVEYDTDIPCWSLAALIDILPVDWWGYTDHYFLEISKMGDATTPNEVRYFRFRKPIDGANHSRITHISHSAENLIDACVNMIITLHTHKLLPNK